MATTQITALIQSYCGKDRIIPTLESCKMQDYPHKDLVIADDASNDGKTVLIIENWLEKNTQHFTNVTFIKNSQNLGIVKNYRNAALKAHGDIIIPLGQGDTFYSTETFSRIATEIEKQREQGLKNPLVWLGYYKSYELNSKWREVNDHLSSYPFSMRLLVRYPNKALIKLLEGNFIASQSFVYNKEYFQEGVFPIPDSIKNSEDYAMSVWMLITQKKFGHLPLFVRWYEKGTGISASRNIAYMSSLRKVYDFIEEITRPYPKLNKIALESKKMHELRSINNCYEREIKKILFRISRTVLNPVKALANRVFVFKKKLFVKTNSANIIKQIEAQSGKPFNKDFFI